MVESSYLTGPRRMPPNHLGTANTTLTASAAYLKKKLVKIKLINGNIKSLPDARHIQ